MRSISGGPPVCTGLKLDRHRRIGRYLRHVGKDELLPANGGEGQIQPGKSCQRTGQRPRGDDHHVGPNLAPIGRHPDDSLAGITLESRHRLPGAKPRTAGASEFERKASWFEPAVTLAKPGVDDVVSEIGKSAAGLCPIEQLDVGQTPLALGLGLLALGSGAIVGGRDVQITLVPQAKVHALLKIVEEVDTFANQRDFVGVVELEAKGTGGDRRGQRGQCRPFFNDDGLESRAFSEKSCGTADDAPADDDEVGGVGR
jgi:hypothetical protein